MAVKTVTGESFKNEVLQANLPVLVDFYADWCGPCRMLRPTLEQLSDERNDVIAAAVNIDENPELADMLCVMAQSAYDEKCIKSNYAELGYENCYTYDYDTTYTKPDNCGYAIGYRDMEDGTREYLVTVRGTKNGLLEVWGEEWWSDFNVGYSQIDTSNEYPKFHGGFYPAAYRIYESLYELSGERILTNKSRFVFTGHSRGSAVSNLVASWLINDGLNKKDLYAYNFACPNVALDYDSKFASSTYSSIFNLNCARDLVGQAPGINLSLATTGFWSGALYGDKELTQWGKYGQTYFWDTDWETTEFPSLTGVATYHPCDKNYIPYFSKQPSLSYFKAYYDMNSLQKKHWAYEKLREGLGVHQRTGTIEAQIIPQMKSSVSAVLRDSQNAVIAVIKNTSIEIEKAYEDRIHAQYVDGRVSLSVNADEDIQIEVQSSEDAPVTIGIAQGTAGSVSADSGTVYHVSDGNAIIGYHPEAPPSLTGEDDKAIEPDWKWVSGDTNMDGMFSVSDIVLMQKWLHKKANITKAGKNVSDMNADSDVDVYDLGLMKQKLLQS